MGEGHERATGHDISRCSRAGNGERFRFDATSLVSDEFMRETSCAARHKDFATSDVLEKGVKTNELTRAAWPLRIDRNASSVSHRGLYAVKCNGEMRSALE